MLNVTRIPGSRVPLTDATTGLVTREWFLFFQNLFFLTGGGSSPTTIPDLETLIGINSGLLPTDQSPQGASLVDLAPLTFTAETLASLLAATEALAAAPVVPFVPSVGSITTTTPITTTGGLNPSIGIVNQGTLTTVLHGNPAGNAAFSAVVEDDLFLSNVTTGDATTARHGFLPILPGTTAQFLNGQGNFATPSGTVNSYSAVSYGADTTFSVVHNFGAFPIVQVLITATLEEIIPLTVIHTNTNQLTITLSASTAITVLLSVGSPQPQTLTTVNSATYTVALGDCIIQVIANPNTTTLLDAATATRRIYYINNASVGDITVDTTAGQFIAGQLTQTLPATSTMTVYSDGGEWWIL